MKIDILFNKALKLVARIDDHFPELATTIRKIQDHKPDRLIELAKVSGLDIRKAYYLARIDRRIGHLGIKAERLVAIGWTKVALIATHIDADNAEELLCLAETHTVQNLIAILRGEAPLTDPHCVLLYFSPAQFGVFKKAVAKYGKNPGGLKDHSRETALIRALMARS
jgi:hypothetical protein